MPGILYIKSTLCHFIFEVIAATEVYQKVQKSGIQPNTTQMQGLRRLLHARILYFKSSHIML